MFYRSILLSAALFSTACNIFSHTEPAAPAPSNLRWTLSGRFLNVGAGPIANARLTVLDGADQGARSATDASGNYAFPSLATGRFHMVIEAAGFESEYPVVDLSRDINVDFALQPAGR